MKSRLFLLLLLMPLARGCLRPTPPDRNTRDPVPVETVAGHLADSAAKLESRLQHDPHDALALDLLTDRHIQLLHLTGDATPLVALEKTLLRYVADHERPQPEALLALARVLMNQHRFAEADQILERCRRRGMGQGAAPTLDALTGDLALERGDLETARAAFDRYAALKDGPGAWIRQARLLGLTGNRRDAIALLEKARDFDPDIDAQMAAWLRWQLAEHHLAFGETVRARAHAQEALDVMPGWAPALATLARTFEREGDRTRPIDLLRQALARVRDPAIVTQLAAGLALSGDETAAAMLRAEAMGHYEIEMSRGLAGHRRALANLLMDRNHDLTRALSLARVECADRPTTESYAVLARALRLTGRLPEALDAINRALSQHTEDATLHREASTIHEALGHEDEALTHRALAHAIDPLLAIVP